MKSLISDNNVINRSAFKLLAGTDPLQPYFLNPMNKSKVFILFDSVHIMKCVRNYLLNVKSIDKTFTFPGLKYTTVIHEGTNTYMLNYKSLHPHSLERQNVILALEIIHGNNPAVLIIQGSKRITLPIYIEQQY